MKKQFNNQIHRISISALLLFCSTIFLFGQNQKSLVDAILKNPEYKDQWSAIEKMRKENFNDNKIIDYLELQSKTKGEEIRRRSNSQLPTSNSQSGSPKLPVTNAGAPCSGLGVEGGWGAWTARTGAFNGGTIKWDQAAGAGIAPTGPRFNLTSGAGTDGCPGTNSGDPIIPVVSPGFGNTSLQIGEPQANGTAGGCKGGLGGLLPAGCAEELTYPLLVTAADTNFVYSYAVVIGDGGHSPSDQASVSFGIYKANGDTVDCSYFKYIALAGNTPVGGFYTSTCSGVYYKPWTLVGINLKPYIGQTLNVVITNTDCGPGGHYAYGYFDFNCGTLSGNMSTGACGAPATICGPVDPQIAYTYTWSVNGSPYTGNPGSNAQCINPAFQTGDVFSVAVGQPSGCGFYLVFQPQSANTMSVTTNGTEAICGVNNGTATANASGSSGYIYSWSTNPTQSTQTATGLGAGTYSVTVTDAGGCSSTKPVTITVGNGPTATTSGINATCIAPGSATVSATGGTAPYTYNWSPGGQAAPAATGLGVGTYTATVTDAGGCSSTQTVIITGTSPPTAAFSNAPVCLGNPSLFTDHSTPFSAGDPISTYSWSFGDGNTASLQNSSNTYTVTGTYTVTEIITTASGCVDSVKVPVTVNGMPVAAFSSSTVCAGNQTQLTDGSTPSGGVAWSWALPGGNPVSSTSQNPSVSYPAGGTYNATLTVTTPAGCKNIISLPVIVNSLPVADFSSTPVCVGNLTTLTDNSSPPNTGGTVTNWSWNFQNGNPAISNSQNPTVTFPVGTNNATFVITASNGCISSVIHPVIVRGLPSPDFNANTPCMGNATSLLDGSTADSPSDPITSWNWNMPGGSPAASTSSVTSTFYSTPGTHVISLTVVTQGGCKDTISQLVTVHAPPVANFSGFGTGCIPVCVKNYTDSSTTTDGSINAWVWSFPGGMPSSSILSNPGNICYNTAGTFGASLIVTTIHGCTDSIAITPLVNTYPWPSADFCIDHTIAPATDPVFTFCPLWSPNPGVTNWVWDFGDGTALDSTSTNPSHSYSLATTSNDFSSYTIKLLVKNQYGCWDTISKVVELIPEFEFYIPNCFTPNTDYTNEFFFGKCRGVKDYNIWIFDRWGNQVWDCHYTGKNTDFDMPGSDGMASTCKWDGKVVKGGVDMSGNSGQLAQEDVYVWKVRLKDIFDKTHTYIGHVSIVR